MAFEIDPKQREVLQREFIYAIKQEGLVLVPEAAGVVGLDFLKKQNKLMKKTAVSAYQVGKYKLINGVTTYQTICNWIKANVKLKDGDYYYTKENKLMILTYAIKRINNEL